MLKPLPRVLYLLELAGFPLEEGSIDVDPDFLAEIMELNEEILEVGEAELKIIEENISKELDNYYMTIEILLENEEYEAARKEVAHMKYYVNVQNKILAMHSEFGGY